jgi:hypothetical protein
MLRSLFMLLAFFAVVAVADGPKDDKPPKDDKAPKADKPKADKPKADKPKAEENPKSDKPKVEEEPKSAGWALDAGKNVPSAFHPYQISGPHINRVRKEEDDIDQDFVESLKKNLHVKEEAIAPYLKKASVSRNKKLGRFHCPVSHHGLDPLMVLFVQENNWPELKSSGLLEKLDAVVKNNPNVRLSVAVVVISGELDGGDKPDDPEVANRVDDKREELAKVIGETGQKLDNIALCLTNKRDDDLINKWELNRGDAPYVSVLANKFKIVAAEAIKKKLDAVQVQAVLDTLVKHFKVRP